MTIEDRINRLRERVREAAFQAKGQDLAWLLVLQEVLCDGDVRRDRTGVGTISLFDPFALRAVTYLKDFPLIRAKRVAFKRGVVPELCWFLRGETNVAYLHERGCHIWDEWADDKGDLGPVYGAQWRTWPDFIWGDIDQVYALVQGLKTNPNSRRHIVSAWNTAEVNNMALPPCHMMFQCYVDNDKQLHMKMYQRSADLFLGVPFNIASYALLNNLLAHAAGLSPGRLTISFGDAHIYLNHLDALEKMFDNIISNGIPHKPVIVDITHPERDHHLRGYDVNNFALTQYESLETVKAKVAV